METLNFVNKDNELILSLEINWETREIECVYEKEIKIVEG